MSRNGEIPPDVVRRALEERIAILGECVVSDRTPSHRYARIGWGSGLWEYAHRIAWIDAHGEIPDGLTVDHVCRRTKCVNVAHLRLLPNSENGQLNGNAVKTECVNGHSLADAYVLTPPGRRPRRVCRPCHIANAIATKRKRRS